MSSYVVVYKRNHPAAQVQQSLISKLQCRYAELLNSDASDRKITEAENLLLAVKGVL